MAHTLSDLEDKLSNDPAFGPEVFQFALDHGHFSGVERDEAETSFYQGVADREPQIRGLLQRMLPHYNASNPDLVERTFQAANSEPDAKDVVFQTMYDNEYWGAIPTDPAQEVIHRQGAWRQYETDIVHRGTADTIVRRATPAYRQAASDGKKFNKAAGVAALAFAAMLGSCTMGLPKKSQENIGNIASAAALVAGIGVVAYGLRKRA